LTTDGLSNTLPEQELRAAVANSAPRDAIATLLQQAEANDTDDNASAIVFAILEGSETGEPNAAPAVEFTPGKSAPPGLLGRLLAVAGLRKP
jgi:serine/threonine protein phosphatase PrpC